ncbi:hypothetical protein BGZ61DRAFT_438525 [Ilyonectria robusta]|uniref:uncharacterized protein n=1 Tax=Ilyonectria robusta TaxID=1079257 RepID=UPI001E8E057A|nr:uncharacterized protein BGZ61DRAFT_438525 [Ilyonectria robusta]KAH8737538.1 hypothetical protein BGZ61DRAFT_438525 [Ilyonectria robusta]
MYQRCHGRLILLAPLTEWSGSHHSADLPTYETSSFPTGSPGYVPNVEPLSRSMGEKIDSPSHLVRNGVSYCANAPSTSSRRINRTLKRQARPSQWRYRPSRAPILLAAVYGCRVLDAPSPARRPSGETVDDSDSRRRRRHGAATWGTPARGPRSQAATPRHPPHAVRLYVHRWYRWVGLRFTDHIGTIDLLRTGTERS